MSPFPDTHSPTSPDVTEPAPTPKPITPADTDALHDTIPVLTTRQTFRGYNRLMPRRVKKILLVSSLYDKFILEEDGHLTERVISEYLDLNLGYPPHIERCSQPEIALEMLAEEKFDLVVSMLRLGTVDAFTFSHQVKALDPDLPVLLLAHNMIGLEELLEEEVHDHLDGVFVWGGDARLMLALAKLVEDQLNVDHDTAVGDVRVIVLVEDSPFFYSTYLVLLYTALVQQTEAVMEDSVNLAQQVLRRRTRPKVLLAKTYEEAIELCDTYGEYLLGVISDVRFPRGEVLDPDAGLRLLEHLRARFSDMPVLLQSSDESNRERARLANAAFVNKDDQKLLTKISQFIHDNFGFGDFVFRLPDGAEVGRAHTIRDMANQLQQVPVESIGYHAQRNHFSNWLRARTEFNLASAIKPVTINQFRDLDALRRWLAFIFEDLERQKLVGEIVDFSPDAVTRARFLRIGSGSLGGKARGLAFMNAIIYRQDLSLNSRDIRVELPRTAVIATDHYDHFIEDNRLNELPEHLPDERIAHAFLNARLPVALDRDLHELVQAWTGTPLAVRSSSRLEDAMYRPFAGVYLTKMIPNHYPDSDVRFRQLVNAVKLVYASTWFRHARDYLAATRRSRKHVEDEKMAVIIQRVVGARHGGYFYPEISGVARSYNYYPIGDAAPEDGVVSLAFGLGKTVVDGGRVLTYSPARPTVYPEFTSADAWLDSQNRYWAINEAPHSDHGHTAFLHLGDAVADTQYLKSEYVADAREHGTLRFVASTYDAHGSRINDGLHANGSPLVTFAPVLKQEVIPLNDLVKSLLKQVERAMNCPVEIEFALRLDPENGAPAIFYLLQVRPLVVQDEQVVVEIDPAHDDVTLAWTEKTLGNGVWDDIIDIVYVKPDGYSPSFNPAIAGELERFNRTLREEGRRYVLIGFGRWGSSDPWLGIPVNWSQISHAQAIVEAQTPGLVVDPSQGSHFFHNLTSFEVAYFTLHYSVTCGEVDYPWLATHEAVAESDHVRHVRLEKPLHIRVDGRTGKGAIFKEALEHHRMPEAKRDPRYSKDSGIWKAINGDAM